ncbi:hypothetical protein LINPERHAP2_LOCUS32198 [Linum perenne]
MFDHLGSTNKYKRQDTKLEKKIIEIKRASSTAAAPGPKTFKSINTIIMGFPQFKEQLKDINGVFEQFGNKKVSFFFSLF